MGREGSTYNSLSRDESEHSLTVAQRGEYLYTSWAKYLYTIGLDACTPLGMHASMSPKPAHPRAWVSAHLRV